jgi:replicative DNA helicase
MTERSRFGLPRDDEEYTEQHILAHERMLIGDALRGRHRPFGLPVAYFINTRHQLIWRIILELDDRGEKTDRVSVANELLRLNELERAGGLTYLVSFEDYAP